ncbi:MAG: PAS domain S-box protein [Prosthecobacter sp.]
MQKQAEMDHLNASTSVTTANLLPILKTLGDSAGVSSVEAEIADALPVLIAVLDAETRYCFCNSAYEDWFGLEPKQLIGKRFVDVVGEDVANVATPHIKQVLAGHDVNFEGSFAYRHGPERQVNVHYTPQLDAAGHVTGYVSLTVDVSHQRATETRLRELTQQLEMKVRERTEELNDTLEALQATIESSPDTMIVMDAGGIILNANSAAERLFGISTDQLLGQHLKTFLPANDVDDFTEFFEESKQASPDIRSTKPRQSRLRHASGKHIPIEAAIGVSPRLDHYTAFIRDISNRRRLENDLLHVALEERHRIARDLHDSLCQEISAVHFGLAGLAQTLECTQASEATHARKLAVMLEETLDHARKIAHGLSPVMAEGDDVVRALMRLARNTEELCGLKCRVEARSDLQNVDRDVGSQIYYITQEALSNTLRHAKARQITISISTNEDEVVLRVTDDGSGFQPSAESDGRGLRFMRYRAAAVNGTLRLRNRPEGGTELLCCIPLSGGATPIQ